jgi:hypothetical protein
MVVHGLALGLDGSMYIADSNSVIRRDDGHLVCILNQTGCYIRTVDVLTGAIQYRGRT